MKKIIILIVAVLAGYLTIAQTRPEVVDNTKYFPPLRYQALERNCTNFSLIYYLKSAIWNKRFDRDPSLLENQFSHSFIWNQNVSLANPIAGLTDGYKLMESQGCATVSDFALNELSASLKPSTLVKERALAYKSKRLIYNNFRHKYPNKSNYENMTIFINELKDSLINGSNFLIGLILYEEFNELTNGDVYNYLDKYSDASKRIGAHMVVISGYDDTIKTASGRGAFKAVNSSIVKGVFYLDYQWFYHNMVTSSIWFLEEDFTSNPEIALHLQLENSLTAIDEINKSYIFTETLQTKENGKKVDFITFEDDRLRTNVAQIVGINGKKLDLRSNSFLLPTGSDDGSYHTIYDLTDLSSAQDFESVEIIVFDPISGVFIGEDDKEIYSYNRESKLKVSKSWINILGTNEMAMGEVKDLPDTTIVLNNYYSLQARNLVNRKLSTEEANDGVLINYSKCVLHRKLVTITKDDLKLNTVPVWEELAPDVTTYQDSTYNYQFKGKDLQGENLTYKLSQASKTRLVVGDGHIHYGDDIDFSDVSLDENTGTFSYTNRQPTPYYAAYYNFAVEASDGMYSIVDTFSILVEKRLNEWPYFIGDDITGDMYDQEVFNCKQDSVLIFNFQYLDHGDQENTVVYLETEEVEKSSLVLDWTYFYNGIQWFAETRYKFQFDCTEVGVFKVRIVLQNDIHTVYKDYTINVTPNTGLFDKPKADLSLKAYPNPVLDFVNFDFILQEREVVNFEVFNLLGQLMHIERREMDHGLNTLNFDATMLKAGVYVCRFKLDNNKFQTVKISKR